MFSVSNSSGQGAHVRPIVPISPTLQSEGSTRRQIRDTRPCSSIEEYSPRGIGTTTYHRSADSTLQPQDESNENPPTYQEALRASRDDFSAGQMRRKAAAVLQELEDEEDNRWRSAVGVKELQQRSAPTSKRDANVRKESVSIHDDAFDDTNNTSTSAAPESSKRSVDSRKTSALSINSEELVTRQHSASSQVASTSKYSRLKNLLEPDEESASAFEVELDSIPISRTAELCGDEPQNPSKGGHQYGDKQFNTLPGEPFPLSSR